MLAKNTLVKVKKDLLVKTEHHRRQNKIEERLR